MPHSALLAKQRGTLRTMLEMAEDVCTCGYVRSKFCKHINKVKDKDACKYCGVQDSDLLRPFELKGKIVHICDECRSI